MKITQLEVGEGAFMLGSLALVRLPSGLLIGSKDAGIKLASMAQFEANDHRMDMNIEKVTVKEAIERLELAKPVLAASADWENLMLLDFARTQYILS